MKGLLIFSLLNLIKGCSLKKIQTIYYKTSSVTSNVTSSVTTSSVTTSSVTTLSVTTLSVTTSSVTTSSVTMSSIIPITNGKYATLTYFTDTVTQCYGSNIPAGNSLAVNPLLLGFTLNDWNTKFSDADPNNIPWCGKMMNVTVNGKTYIGRIIDTCNPGDEGAFLDPNTGQVIGGKCGYTNVIDLYGDLGLSFLQNTVGDDFYQGDLEWVII